MLRVKSQAQWDSPTWAAMNQDQKGSKWSKIVKMVNEESGEENEEEVESDEEDEIIPKLEYDLKTEVNVLTRKEDGVSGASIVSDSINFSIIWLDRMCGITPTTKRGQTIYMVFMLLIPLIPIFALITQNVIQLNDVIIRREDLTTIDKSVEGSDEAARLVSGLQQERSESIFSLFVTNNIETQISIGLDIKRRFDETDEALEKITR